MQHGQSLVEHAINGGTGCGSDWVPYYIHVYTPGLLSKNSLDTAC